MAVDAREISKGLGDHQSVCIIEGLLAQLYLADGDLTLARKHARNAQRFAAKIPPTNFSTLEGIAAPAQVGAALRDLKQSDPALDEMIRSGRKALKAYARVFPVAKPRQALVEGIIAERNGDVRAARRWFEKAQAQAQKSGMSYEQRSAKTALNSLQEVHHGTATKLH